MMRHGGAVGQNTRQQTLNRPPPPSHTRGPGNDSQGASASTRAGDSHALCSRFSVHGRLPLAPPLAFASEGGAMGLEIADADVQARATRNGPNAHTADSACISFQCMLFSHPPPAPPPVRCSVRSPHRVADECGLHPEIPLSPAGAAPSCLLNDAPKESNTRARNPTGVYGNCGFVRATPHHHTKHQATCNVIRQNHHPPPRCGHRVYRTAYATTSDDCSLPLAAAAGIAGATGFE